MTIHGASQPMKKEYKVIYRLHAVRRMAMRHVVLAVDEESSEKIVVTVYEPDIEKWNEDMKTRRRS
jgi:hypothetical protein